MLIKQPKIFSGGFFQDFRGIIRHSNEFKLENICRFYTIEHLDTDIIRAWQGHKFENKYFFPIKGKFVLAWTQIDNFHDPSLSLKAEFRILSDNNPLVIHVPKGFANGLRALRKNSIIGVFSDMENEQSAQEKIRYPSDWWFNWYQNFEGNT